MGNFLSSLSVHQGVQVGCIVAPHAIIDIGDSLVVFSGALRAAPAMGRHRGAMLGLLSPISIRL